MKKIIYIFFILFLLYYGFLKLPKIDSVAYNPPPIPKLEGALKPNIRLLEAKKILLEEGFGAEDVEVDLSGNLYTGLEDGSIVKIHRDLYMKIPNNINEIRIKPEMITNTGGRPLGLRFGYDGNLYVADVYKGLLKIDFKNNYQIEVIAIEAEGIPFRFTDHLDIAKDGKIYFTDASYKYSQKEYLYDLLESRPNGRFLMYDPQTKKTTVLIKYMYFPNGVALSEEETFVLVNETYRYRIWKYWLQGEKKGNLEIFYDNLPGFPDNIRTTKKGFWLCLFTKRNEIMDAIHPFPILKNFLSGLPKILWPKPAKYGFIIQFDSEGNILETFQNPDFVKPMFTIITGIKEYNKELFFSSLYGNWIGWLKLESK